MVSNERNARPSLLVRLSLLRNDIENLEEVSVEHLGGLVHQSVLVWNQICPFKARE